MYIMIIHPMIRGSALETNGIQPRIRPKSDTESDPLYGVGTLKLRLHYEEL